MAGKVQGLFFSGNGNDDKCPAGEGHNGSDNLKYHLPFTSSCTNYNVKIN